MVWPMVIAAGVSAVGSIVSANSASAQNENQAAWNRYNAQMGYNNDMSNIQSQTMLGMFNAAMQMRAADYNASMLMQTAEFNVQQVNDTALYNDALLEEEGRLMWEAAELDMLQLARQREAERGDILAHQSASGTSVGYGANAEVIIQQRAEESMDAFIIRHNADIGASKIANARAQGAWQAEAQTQKIMFEGQMGAAMSTTNAQLASQGIMMETMLSADAGTRSAGTRLSAGMSGATMSETANTQQINNNLTQGLFSSASSAASSYYGGSTVDSGSLLTEGSTWTNPDTNQPWSG